MKEKITEQLPQAQPTITPSSQTSTWILIVVGGLIAIAGGVYFGLGTAKRFETVISDKQPKPTYISQPIPTTEPKPSGSIIPAPSGTPSPSPDTTDKEEHVLDFSDTRVITENDLISLTPWELKVARNEIYALHGREFVHQDLSCYFDNQAWYQINSGYTDSELSILETTNATFILNYEKEINSPLINKDSGCDQGNP